MEYCDLTLKALSSMLRSGKLSPVELLSSVIKRIEAKEEGIHSYITLTLETAMEAARRAQERYEKHEEISLLDGIPIAIKDNLATKGIKTTCGSMILKDYVPPYNATVVERLLSQGAVMVGKANMDEFAMGSSTENSAFGPTRNPYSSEHVAGGSSGGSAAAVAAGEAIAALGSDTGGSIRQPAAFCGVVGLKPTYGRVSRYGLVAFASSLDQVGPITRSVEDCAILLNAIAGHDPMDSTSADIPVPDYTSYLGRSIKGLKVGIPREYTAQGIDPDVLEAFQRSVIGLSSEGVRLVEISFPHTPYAIAAYYIIATAEASSNLARYDGVKYGTRSEAEDLLSMYEGTRSLGFGREVKRRIMLGTYVLSSGYYEAYYQKAMKVRTLIRKDFESAFQAVDVIAAPVSPVPTFRIGERIKDPLSMYLVDAYTVPVNLSGLPAISIPCGTLHHMPLGIQFIGRPFEEGILMQLGHAFEQSLGVIQDGI